MLVRETAAIIMSMMISTFSYSLYGKWEALDGTSIKRKSEATPSVVRMRCQILLVAKIEGKSTTES